jgi:hypothetical protein
MAANLKLLKNRTIHIQAELSKGKARQGCQMVVSKPKIPNLGKFSMSLNGKCWNILWPFGICNLCPFGIGSLWSFVIFFSQFGMFGPRKIWQPCWVDNSAHTSLYYENDTDTYCNSVATLLVHKSVNMYRSISNENDQRMYEYINTTVLRTVSSFLFKYFISDS